MDGRFLAFLGVAVVLIVTPGPDTALVTRNAFRGGVRSVSLTALGVRLGLLTWGAASRLKAGAHARLLAALAAREGVAVVAGEAFGAGADRVRLSYTSCTPELAAEAVRRLRAALEQLPGLAVSQPPSGTPVVV